jgi:hypothetical protein
MLDESLSALLNSPIAALEVSNDFKKKCFVMKFGSLADIVATPPEEIRQRTGFDYTWLGELVRLLSKAKLLHLLQPIPGSGCD